MGTLLNKKYPQVATRQEIAFLVMGYLKEEKFKQTLEVFEKEGKSVIKNMKLSSKKVKSLPSILNEYIFLKNEEKKKMKFINSFGQDPQTKSTMQNLYALLEDYSLYREMFLPQRRPHQEPVDEPIQPVKPNKNPTSVHTPANTMQIDTPQIHVPPPSIEPQTVIQAGPGTTNNTNTSPSGAHRPVPHLPVIEVLESPAPKHVQVPPTIEHVPLASDTTASDSLPSQLPADHAPMLLSPPNGNKTVTRTPITSTPRRKTKPRKYSPSPKAKQSLNFDADQEADQVPDELSRDFVENGFKLLMQNQPLQQKLADLINSRLAPEPIVADPNEWIPPNAIDEILNSLTTDPMFEPLFHSEHIDALNLSHQSSDSSAVTPAAHQTFDSNPNNNTINNSSHNSANNNVDHNRDLNASFERLNTSTDNLLNFNAFSSDKTYPAVPFAQGDEIDFAALLNTSTDDVDPHVQNTASFFHSILQSTETLTPLHEELEAANETAAAQSVATNNNNNNAAASVVPQHIENSNQIRPVSNEWRNFLNNSNTVNAVPSTDSNSAIVNNNNSNSGDENSKSKTSQRRKRKILGTKRSASVLEGESDQQLQKKQKVTDEKLPENLDVELFLSQLNYK